ncbi:hypothetical protein BU26DRAFT_509959 [Trematosphaeria pertusa]|uniref:Uncharacterized protein n=1 Tax=Trematosphaeria pertusa TaxID=390896 RepID=A0A6A6HZF6_9PLEO|nr:uncharacterized protein BU26DRAFT_509959 [Trematosphaeria pertusa]KAF2243451.1 hypothetical protein BU26DRAFT_509959 [Trematosphaeria pertusa]
MALSSRGLKKHLPKCARDHPTCLVGSWNLLLLGGGWGRCNGGEDAGGFGVGGSAPERVNSDDEHHGSEVRRGELGGLRKAKAVGGLGILEVGMGMGRLCS